MRRQIPRIGVYICHCGSNIASKVDVERVRDYAATLDYVVVSRDYKFMCSNPGQQLIIDDIQEKNLNRVVVASCSPRMHEKTFRKASAKGGINPYYFQMATIREQSSWVTDDPEAATLRAMDLVRAAVYRVTHHEALAPRIVDINQEALVIGGGIAGIEAALEIAEANRKVYIVEKEPSLGGHMAKLDRVFPTLDNAMDILKPKMEKVYNHKNIEVLTYSEVDDVEGFVGNFTVKVKRKPRYINVEKCTGCGECIESCPNTTLSEFDENIGERKAIYFLFKNAMPNVPIIDTNNCSYFKDGSCKKCEEACKEKAIDFNQPEEIKEINVGAIIVTTGYKLFDPSNVKRFGYGKYDDVYTSMQFERLSSELGPTNGKIVTKKGKKPQSVAIVHCVGSRDKNFNKYCSRVCCLYSLKYAQVVKEKTGADVYNFYIDIRAFGKNYEEFYHAAQEKGTIFIRGNGAKVTDKAENPEEKGKLVIVAEDSITKQRVRVPVDMVILSVGLQPPDGTEDLARKVGVSVDLDGWINELHAKLAPVSTPSDGVFIAGCCQGPKDISDSVAQAHGAAAEALSLMMRGQVEMEAATSYIDPELCTGCRQCMDICMYGAINFIEYKHICEVNSAICKGCGLCAATCPSKAANLKHFNNDEVFAEIEALAIK
jgi:heterodisulfide reductase subunit A